MFDHVPGIQLVALNLLNLTSLIYLGQQQPFDNRFKNRIEMFNEFTVCICSMLMMCFTNFIPEIETQSFMGWQMIGVIVINCAVNVTIIVSIGGRGLWLIGLKYYRRIKFKLFGTRE